MDPALRRRSRLPIHLLLVAVTVLALLAARSGAEVITLTEETFSDKVRFTPSRVSPLFDLPIQDQM
jgi:thioredoxin domain-containing protein 5